MIHYVVVEHRISLFDNKEYDAHNSKKYKRFGWAKRYAASVIGGLVINTKILKVHEKSISLDLCR